MTEKGLEINETEKRNLRIEIGKKNKDSNKGDIEKGIGVNAIEEKDVDNMKIKILILKNIVLCFAFSNIYICIDNKSKIKENSKANKENKGIP